MERRRYDNEEYPSPTIITTAIGEIEHEEGWHRVFMYETFARERKKHKNESMNVHGWYLYGCICCKFSFKSYKLVEKYTAKIVKGSSNLILTGCFVTLTHEKTKSHFLFIFFKDGHGKNVWIYAVIPSAGAKIKRKRETRMQKKKKVMWLC